MQYHAKTKEGVFQELETSQKGLIEEQAKNRLSKYGKNKLKIINRLEPVKIFFQQFDSFLIYILIFSAVVSFLINHLIDGIVISVIVFVNAGIGFFQQYKAERSIQNLKEMLIPYSIVIRNGKHKKINSELLVPGDIVVLNSGDKINADCRIIESENLQTNEAVLTGESLPIAKSVDKIPLETTLAERINMLYTGTQVVRGGGKAVVVSTGSETEFGKIASTIQKVQSQKTPIQKNLDKFSKQIGIFILLLVTGIAALGFIEHFDFTEMFLTSIALAVSAIPEGLPAVLSISFAIASVFMSRKNVVVRKLPAVESLGSVTVICTDKTGTLTEEKMQVEKIFADGKFFTKKSDSVYLKDKKINLDKNSTLYRLFKTATLASNARFEKTSSENSQEKNYNVFGDPTETAFVLASLELGLNRKNLTEKEPRIKEFEFTSDRKMMSVFRESAGSANTLYTKGAPEKILDSCASELVNGQIKKLNEKRKKELLKKSHEFEKQAYRVLGFSYKNFTKKSKPKEQGMIFLGFAGMIDPPRKEVKKAISDCINAGIAVKMITGDSLVTAKAIAKKIGITGTAVLGKEIEKMSDSVLASKIDKIGIFARTTPQQKLRITKTLQEKKEVVAITGDGVNDSLALKSADIGIAMGIRGTDVAREVSDIVLIDDNFASIVEGVRQGRKVYDNIKKFTKYLLAVNFSEIFLVLVALTMRLPLPLLPLQILWMNLVTDSFPALTLVMEKEEGVMKTKPRKEKSILENIWKFIVLAGIMAFAVEIFIYFYGMQNAFPIDKTRTMVLTTGILFELFFIYSCRNSKPLLETGIFSNKLLNYSIIFSVFAQLVLLYTGLGTFFKVVPLSLNDWLLIIPIAFSGLFVFEVAKYVRKIKSNK